MAVTVEERYKGRAGSSKKRAITYLVRGTDDDSIAIADTVTAAPTTWDGLYISDVSATQLADDIFATVATYGEISKPDKPAQDSVAFEFSYSATSEHVRQSIANISKQGAPGITAYDYHGCINVVDDGGHLRVEGVDIPVPPVTHSWTYYPVNATVSTAYQNTVLGLMGKVNSAAFKGAQAGEVRFVACRGGVRSNEDWQIRFDFAFSKNQTNIQYGEITGIAKKGHEIMWALYGDVLDGNGWKVKKPMVAYVEQVIQTADLNGLGI